MKLILLTHSRETQKTSNTGRLVQQTITACKTIIWQRTQVDKGLLQLIEANNSVLLYPSDESSADKILQASDILQYEHFILIDSTWQEARKIYNRSPYLQKLPCIQLSSQLSNYHLRRNQVKNGLCTAECVIELLRVGSHFAQADKLEQVFKAFLVG